MRVGAEVRFPLACILLPKARSDTYYAQDNGKADAHSSDQLHKPYGSRWQDRKRKGEGMKGSWGKSKSEDALRAVPASDM